MMRGRKHLALLRRRDGLVLLAIAAVLLLIALMATVWDRPSMPD
jgi:hypothetical protein